MTKTMTTNEIIETAYALDALLAKDIDLSAKVIWDLEDNIDAMKGIVDKFNKMREKLIAPLRDKGAFEQADDETVRVKAEFADEFMEVNVKMNEFLELEHEIDFVPIKRSDLPDTLTAKDIRAIKIMTVKE